ncbi:MAG: S41 family peptidase [Gemmataceae bacterium]
MRNLVAFATFLIVIAVPPVRADEEARLLRFPAIHGDQVVFTYAGNLYAVSAGGGTARRLTSHEGFEMFARFSPDGKQIAFTGQYDGNTEVYVMPAEGGAPKRLTFTATLARDDVSDRMGPNNIVMGWTPDGKNVLFRSRMRSFNDFLGQLYLAPIEGGLPEQLPLPRGGFASYSPDGKKLAFNRVFREFRTWKRYRGGMADDVWIYDFETKKTENVTNNEAQDIIPMWSGNKIYFVSDRDANKRMNLYVCDLATKTTEGLTQFKDFDVKFPSLGDKAIVFENGGYIYKLDLATKKVDKIPVYIHEDHGSARGGLYEAGKNINSYEIAPDGKRALFTARGDIFTVPQHGLTRNLTGTPGVHERNAKWSPDGKTIAFISDSTGEDEIHVMAADGSDAAQTVTTGGDTYKYDIVWSPDGKKILWADKKLRLQFVDVASKKVTEVIKATAFEISDYVWSPDSKWVAYAKPEEEAPEKIYLYSVDQNKNFEVTDGWHGTSQPAFSSDGKYLFFVSNRDYRPVFSQIEFNFIYQDLARIYFVTLAKETESPFKPRNDEVGAGDKPAPATDPGKKEGAPIKVDTDGLKERVLSLPVQPANYRHLVSAGGVLYYQRASTRDPSPTLAYFDLTARKETALGNVNGYEISADQKKMLVSMQGRYAIIDLPRGPISLGEALNLSGIDMKLDRRKEWKQIYNECWRQMRDFFFDANMHGVDWKAIHDKYEPLVAHVDHRADLTYLIGEMIGELNVGHTYVGGGDYPVAPRIQTGLLGAELKRDDKTKYFQIKKILKGATWDSSLHAPLDDLGVGVKEGEYIVAVNGQPTNEMTNIFETLINTAGKPIQLKVGAEPQGKGARTVTVTPIADEAKLYYHDWVQNNIKKVSEATGGKVGYLHIPDMQVAGLNEFVKYFYPQLGKKALIIDVRGNGGGNISPMLIERLRREIAMVDIARNTAPIVDPPATFNGPMVCLLNEFSASDGDLFPYRFKHYKLGQLIGKRSWGGVVGIRGTLPLLDGGYLNKPEFSRYDLEGKKWIIEGYGVDPDIVVDNDPAKEYAGIDEQLNKAIEVIQQELKIKEKKLPPAPPYPKK